MIPNFGFAEADVNYNNNVEIADVVVSSASSTASRLPRPVHCVLSPGSHYKWRLDADNFLTMNGQVPVAGIYLELVGVIDEIRYWATLLSSCGLPA